MATGARMGMLSICTGGPVASGGNSIAAAPTVVYGQQEFGNTDTEKSGSPGVIVGENRVPSPVASRADGQRWQGNSIPSPDRLSGGAVGGAALSLVPASSHVLPA